MSDDEPVRFFISSYRNAHAPGPRPVVVTVSRDHGTGGTDPLGSMLMSEAEYEEFSRRIFAPHITQAVSADYDPIHPLEDLET